MQSLIGALRLYGTLILSWAAAVVLSVWGYVAWMLPVPEGVEEYANTVSYQLTMFTIFVFPLWLLVLAFLILLRRRRGLSK